MSSPETNKCRMDKWLWAARFFKTRALATRACELGRVEAHGTKVKASREVRVGDALEIKTEAGTFGVQVLALSDVRGPAATAQTLYSETEASWEARRRVDDERKQMLAMGAVPESRPSKRDRSQLERLRGRG